MFQPSMDSRSNAGTWQVGRLPANVARRGHGLRLDARSAREPPDSSNPGLGEVGEVGDPFLAWQRPPPAMMLPLACFRTVVPLTVCAGRGGDQHANRCPITNFWFLTSDLLRGNATLWSSWSLLVLRTVLHFDPLH